MQFVGNFITNAMELNNNIHKQTDFIKENYTKNKCEKAYLTNRHTAIRIFVAIIACGCYLNSLNGDFVHDDIFAIKNNRDVTGKTSLFLLFHNDFWGKPMLETTSHKSYRPLTTLTFRWNYYLSGESSYSFHVTNVILHGIMTYLFMYVCQYVLFLPLSCVWMSGALFAVHPIHTEAVSGIVGRADILAGIFFMLSFLAYVKGIDESWQYYAEFPVTKYKSSVLFSMVLGAISMLCKEQGITVLGVCMVYDVTVCCRRGILQYLKDRKIDNKCLPLIYRMSVAMFTVLVLMVFRIWMMNGSLPPFLPQDNPASFSPYFITRCLSYSYIWYFNVKLLFCPVKLCYDWQVGSIPLVESVLDTRNLETTMLYITFILLAIHWYRRLKTQYLYVPDAILVGILFMVLPFLPASNLFFRVGFVVAERVLYIPSTGYCILVSYGLYLLSEKFRHYRPIITSSFIILLVLLSSKTWQQNQIWLTRESLFRSGVQTMPKNAKVHYNYANYLSDIGKTAEAKQHYYTAIDLHPDYASAHNNVGVLLKNKTQAEVHFHEAIRIDPKHHRAHINLGALVFTRGERSRGIRLLQEALKYDPHNIDGLLTYGGMMAETQNWNEADRIFKIALEERPDFANVYHNYGTYLQKRGMVAEAVEYYKIAYNLDERHSASMVNAARALNQLGKNKEAENIVNRALAIHRDSSTLDVLGIIYYDLGQIQKSVSVFEEIKQQTPNNTDAILHYVHVLSDLDEFDKAEALLHQILNTEPYHVKALREMAVLLALKSKHEEALPYIGLAVSKCKNPEMLQKLLFQQGNHYKDLKRYDEALKSYNELIKYNPKHIQAHLNIGGIHHLYARLEKARHHYQIALKLDPGNSLATSNLARLQNIEKSMKTNG